MVSVHGAPTSPFGESLQQKALISTKIGNIQRRDVKHTSQQQEQSRKGIETCACFTCQEARKSLWKYRGIALKTLAIENANASFAGNDL